MEEVTEREAQDVEFPDVEVMDALPALHLTLADLHGVKLRITADLGNARMKVKEVLELKVGSVVSLDKTAGDLTDVHLGDQRIARGEVVVIGDILNVRFSEITGVDES